MAAEADSIAVLVSQWKEFNLDGKRDELDALAQSITQRREASLTSRRALAESTKEFRSLDPSAQQAGFGRLLRTYQVEVDNLTRRSRAAESNFLALYKALADLSDPVPGLLSATVNHQSDERNMELQVANERLERELAEFRLEFAGIQNQEVTIRRLEENVRDLREQQAELVRTQVESREEELTLEHRRVVSELQQQLQHAHEQLQQQTRAMEALRSAYDASQSQLVDMQTVEESGDLARQSEVELMSEEVERLKSRIAQLQQQQVKQRKSQAHDDDSGDAGDGDGVTSVAAQVRLQQEEITRLEDLLHEVRMQSRDVVEEARARADVAQAEVDKQCKIIERLTTELQSRPTHQQLQSLQKQVDVLQAMQHVGGVGEDATVEGLLRKKNAHLTTENMQLKAHASQLEQQLLPLREQLKRVQQVADEREQLIHRLEEDLSSAHRDSSSVHGSAITSTSASSPSLSSSTSDVMSTTTSSTTPMTPSNNSTTHNDAVHMLPIVAAQRDRYRERIAELETCVQEQRQQHMRVAAENASLRQDNNKLYHKIRYLSSYNSTASVSKKTDSVPVELAYEGQYKGAYEQSMNPFVTFERSERNKRYKELNPAERVVLQSSRFFLANKWTRLFLFVYSVLLHLLVASTLYYLASTSTAVVLEEVVHDVNMVTYDTSTSSSLSTSTYGGGDDLGGQGQT